MTFDGNISSASLGIMKIQETITEGYEDWPDIEVMVMQASSSRILNTYLNGRHYPKAIKKDNELGCDTAKFLIETKYGSDLFNTGGDGYYGHITQYKQYYGMNLYLSFDGTLFDFEEIKDRMLALFKKRKVNNGEAYVAELGQIMTELETVAETE